MCMPMMQVGVVGMAMNESLVPMDVRMRFARRIVRRMLMLVMLVVNMPMFVTGFLVFVVVLMNFRQM